MPWTLCSNLHLCTATATHVRRWSVAVKTAESLILDSFCVPPSSSQYFQFCFPGTPTGRVWGKSQADSPSTTASLENLLCWLPGWNTFQHSTTTFNWPREFILQISPHSFTKIWRCVFFLTDIFFSFFWPIAVLKLKCLMLYPWVLFAPVLIALCLLWTWTYKTTSCDLHCWIPPPVYLLLIQRPWGSLLLMQPFAIKTPALW